MSYSVWCYTYNYAPLLLVCLLWFIAHPRVTYKTYKCIVACHCCFLCFKGTQDPWNASIACLCYMQLRDLLTSMWGVESSAWEIEKHGTFRPRLSLQGSIHWALQCCTAAVFILSPYWEPLGQYSRHDKSGIHLIPKWRPINCSFVCLLISPLCLVIMYKKQKNFEVNVRQRGLINMQTK